MALADHIIPEDQRCLGLKEKLFTFVAETRAFQDQNPNWREQVQPFFGLVSPWLTDSSDFDDAQRKDAEVSRYETRAAGFDGDQVAQVLNDILGSDKHLYACCKTTFVLAFFLDKYFVANALGVQKQGATAEYLEWLYQQFEMITYHQGPFQRSSYSHIFNLKISSQEMPVFDGLKLINVHESNIPMLLGEGSGPRSFLHPSSAGSVFLGAYDADVIPNDSEWVLVQRTTASQFVTLLQYLKDGIVNLGYSALHFNPPWVNELRKFGLVFVGNPRRQPYVGGQDPYTLDENEIATLNRWQTAMKNQAIKGRLEDGRVELRRTIDRAGTYYEGSHERTEAGERLIALSIALESLFSPGDQSELSFRICQLPAMLLGGGPAERRQIFDSLREMYRLRSKLVHGSYDIEAYRTGKFVTEEQLRTWASFLRRAILGFIVLLLRGYQTRSQVHEKLQEACFNQDVGDLVRKEADLDLFLTDSHL